MKAKKDNDKLNDENEWLSKLNRIISKLESGEWHHLAVTMGDTNFYWVNGEFIGYDEQVSP